MASRIASAAGESSAPATPCIARAAISTPALGAIPHAAEASTKSTRLIPNSRRRPSRSASPPPISRKPPKVRK
ncbi:hypothetical protein ABIA38_003097 [Embleya sp. AB8]